MMREIEIFRLVNVSHSFATRAKGQEVMQSVCDAIARINPEAILVDWTGVSAASPSFIDEFIDGIKRCHIPTPFTGANPDIAILLDTIARRRAFHIEYAECPKDFDGSSINTLVPPVHHL